MVGAVLSNKFTTNASTAESGPFPDFWVGNVPSVLSGNFLLRSSRRRFINTILHGSRVPPNFASRRETSPLLRRRRELTYWSDGQAAASGLLIPRLGGGPLVEVRWTETSALTPSLSPLSLALTPDPSPIGWARGAPRRGRSMRRDVTRLGGRFSTRSGVLRLAALLVKLSS